jgi:hypothetical protein
MGSKDGILCFTSATASTQAHSLLGYNVANSRSLDDKLRHDMMKMKRFYICWSAQLSDTAFIYDVLGACLVYRVLTLISHPHSKRHILQTSPNKDDLAFILVSLIRALYVNDVKDLPYALHNPCSPVCDGYIAL